MNGTRFFLIIAIIFILGNAVIFSISAFVDYKGMQIFNKYQGTSYTYSEWFWGEKTIKEYHEGKKIRLELEDGR